MKALVTGASSGIGRDMCRYLYSLGYELVIVARRKELLEELKNELKNKEKNKPENLIDVKEDEAKINNKFDNQTKSKIEIEVCDISKKENCFELFEKHKDIDLLVNNAGFGIYGEFWKTDLDKEISLIDTNITAVHTLTKLYVKEMKEKNNGKILNVASLAGFMVGPLMATYYASKNYVVSLSIAINKELKKAGSNVRVGILCPGPVDTNFNNVAGVHFGVKPLSSEYVAKYAIDKFLKGKEIIIPGMGIKLAYFGSKFASKNIVSEMAYNTQKAKKN